MHARVARDTESVIVLFDHASREEEHEVLLELAGVKNVDLPLFRYLATRRHDRLASPEAIQKSEIREEPKHVSEQPEVRGRRDRRGQSDLPHDRRAVRSLPHDARERIGGGEHALAEAEQMWDAIAKE